MRAPSFRLERVLCALDVERSARAPLAYASMFSQQFRAPLDRLYVHAPLAQWCGRVERVRRLIAEHTAHERLDALLAPLESSLHVQSFVARGSSGSAIFAHARDRGSDLIVLGGSRRSRTTAAADCASIVATQADCAVLTVPGDEPACAMRRLLLFATSPTADAAALAWTVALAKRFRASVGVVGVRTTKAGFWRALAPSAPSGHGEGHLRAVVAAAIDALVDAGVAVDSLPEPLMDVAQAAQMAESGSHDLAVLGLPAFPGDSVAQVLLERVRGDGALPVLSIRAPLPPVSRLRHPLLERDGGLLASA